MRFTKYILFILLGMFFNLANTYAQIDEGDIEEGTAVLEEKQISEDEVRSRLLKRGIDIDNLRPDQLAGLQNEIEAVIAEIESEEGELQDTSEVVTDIKTDLKKDVKKIAETEVNKTVINKADEVRERVKKGATVDEALSEEMTKSFHDHYKFSSNVYGHDIFFNKSLELYRTTGSTTTPDSYVLDAGDKIAINMFGLSQGDFIYEIEDDGFIRPKNMYKIYLKGVSVAKAEVMLRNRFHQAYTFNDGQFNVDLHTARTITVNIFGEVNQQGSYTISALNTALNALIAAGGPTDEGGVRQIEIISGGKKKYLDVYEFIRNPSVQYNFYLSDNDLIYVPKTGKRVSANGPGFRQQGVYELKENEQFNDLVNLAAGVSPGLYKELIQHVNKLEEEQIITDYSYDEAKKLNLKLSDGDIVILRTSSLPYKNFVQVSGSVRHQGQFELVDSMRVYDVLKKAVFEEETYADVAFLRRKNPDGTYKLLRLYPEKVLLDPKGEFNVLLKKEDVISIYAKSNFVDRYRFSISGAVRQPAQYEWDPEKNITLYDALMMSKGMRPDAVNFGYIVSIPTNNSLRRTYRMIDAASALADPSSEANINIHPNDQIVIPSQTQFSEQFYVQIGGAVRSPGRYVFDNSLNFHDLLTMAGGLRLEAASNKIDVFRLDINENEPTYTHSTTIEVDRNYDPLTATSSLILKPFDYIVVRTTPEFEPMQFVNINGEVKYPGVYALLEPGERVSSLIKRAGGVTGESLAEAGTFVRREDGLGLIVTRLDKVLKREKSHFNIVLKDGDNITIPKIIDVVVVDKAGTNVEDLYTDNQQTGDQLKVVVNYSKHRAGWYIRKFAGGFDRTASKKGTYVQHPNGEVRRTANLVLFKIYPKVRKGSEIHTELKTKHQKAKREKEEKEKRIKDGTIDGSSLIASKEKKDWYEGTIKLMSVVSTLMATTTSAITTVILIKQI